jgi:hypothetical protein
MGEDNSLNFYGRDLNTNPWNQSHDTVLPLSQSKRAMYEDDHILWKLTVDWIQNDLKLYIESNYNT